MMIFIKFCIQIKKLKDMRENYFIFNFHKGKKIIFTIKSKKIINLNNLRTNWQEKCEIWNLSGFSSEIIW